MKIVPFLMLILLSNLCFAGKSEVVKKYKKFEQAPSLTSYEKLQKASHSLARQIGVINLQALDASQDESFVLDLLKVAFPDSLPDTMKGKQMYLHCFEGLYEYRKNFSDKTKFAKYKNCLLSSFNSHLPKNYTRILKSLENIK